MNSLKKSMRLAKVLAFTLSFLIFCFSTAAMAATDTFTEVVQESVQFTNGMFNVNKTGDVSSKTTITSAVVSLSGSENGTIDSIEIIGPNGETEFSCKHIKVSNGTNLITNCGKGKANLAKGSTTYVAAGSGFNPNTSGTLKVNLSS